MTLIVDSVSISFDAVRALDNVSLRVAQGQVMGLIGPNGSGKTTLFNCICGYYTPSLGQVHLDGHEITREPPHKVARRGVGRTFQTPNLFSELTVFDNVHLAAQSAAIGGSILRAVVPGRRGPLKENTLEVLRDLGIENYAQVLPSELPVGIAKLADLARALAFSPKILLLDEPAVGLNDAERLQLVGLLRRLSARDQTSMLVVDHNMGFVMSMCDQLTVLAEGRVIGAGTPDAVRANPAVIKAYLGDESHALA